MVSSISEMTERPGGGGRRVVPGKGRGAGGRGGGGRGGGRLWGGLGGGWVFGVFWGGGWIGEGPGGGGGGGGGGGRGRGGGGGGGVRAWKGSQVGARKGKPGGVQHCAGTLLRV